MSTQPVPHYTIDQYLDLEDLSDHRHEYHDGEILEVAAVSVNHSRIVGATFSGLRTQLHGTGRCEAFISNLGLCIPMNHFVTYPDVFVVCGPLKFYKNRRDAVTEATVIIEVLSPSTAGYDSGEKFRYYRSLPSFSEYLLIAQHERRIEHHVRQSDGSWIFREFTSLDDTIELKSIGCHLSLSAVYERVEFPA